MLGDGPEFHSRTEKLTEAELRAWDAYCQETAGSMSAKDFWSELPEATRADYLRRTAQPNGVTGPVLTYADIKARLDAMTPEQLALPALVFLDTVFYTVPSMGTNETAEEKIAIGHPYLFALEPVGE